MSSHNIHHRARRGSNADAHSSFFHQGGRTVLPPISSAFPTSQLPVIPQTSQFSQQYPARSSPPSRECQVAYNPWPSAHTYAPSHQPSSFNYEETFDAPSRYSSSSAAYISRTSPPLHGDVHSSRRGQEFSMSAGDRWQSTAYTPAQPQIAMGPRSATVTYPMTYPQYTPSHSYLPVLDPRSMPDEVPSVDQMHTFDRSGQLRTSRTASACERRASIVTSPYAPPPATDDNPQIKKKRKRADAAQLQVLNEVYSRTAFPSTEERAELARKLDMTPRSVQIWFQNKRQSMRQTTRPGSAVTSSPQQMYTTSPSNTGFDGMPPTSVGGSYGATSAATTANISSSPPRLPDALRSQSSPSPCSGSRSPPKEGVECRGWNARY